MLNDWEARSHEKAVLQTSASSDLMKPMDRLLGLFYTRLNDVRLRMI
jgi:hypothetical protein